MAYFDNVKQLIDNLLFVVFTVQTTTIQLKHSGSIHNLMQK